MDGIPGLENDAEGSRIVAEELKLLATVTNALAAAEATPEGANNDDHRLMEVREELASARPEDLPALLEQMHHLGALKAQRGRSVTGAVDRKSPYFGHLRLEETVPGKKQVRKRDVLVGARSYVDSSSGIRIVDWRNAPVSRIFYRYREEDDYEETLGDIAIEGNVVIRRSVAITNGQLLRVSAPQGTFIRKTDGTWTRSEGYSARLKSSSEGRKDPDQTKEERVLSAIASMLDGPQYELITKEASGLVVIQGSAGSGKTTVGLHRIAYLASMNPARFRADKMLVVVPNEALIHYTGRVLPDLGVEGVPILTFHRFATRMVMNLLPNLPTRISDETPPAVTRVKMSAAILHAVDEVVAQVTSQVTSRLENAMAKWDGGAEILAAWNSTKEHPPGVRASLVQAWVAGKRDLPGIKAAKLTDITKSAAERVLTEVANKCRNVLAVWDEVTTSRPLMEKVAPTLGEGQLTQFNEWCVRQARIRAEGDRDGEAPSLDSEDLGLLLRIWQKLRGPVLQVTGEPIRLTHLFVDEVQDSGPVELRVLLDLVAPGQPVTLAGDVAQRMLEDDDGRGEFDWRSLLSELGMEAQSVEPLQVSYRSTAEITSFARGVLGPYAHEAEPIATRNGPPVEQFSFASVGEAVSFVADALKELALSDRDANVAVVSRFPQQAQAYYEGLERAEVPNLRRVSKQDFTWDAGVDVTDVRQTKGLEFDEVILVDANAASYPDTSQARHALYVGATRAAHQLWCVASDKPSLLVEQGLAAQAAACTKPST